MPLNPYALCSGAAASGTNNIAVTVATPNASGDCIAVWITNNGSNSATGVSDPVNGSYTSVGSVVSNGVLRGQWFIFPNAAVLNTSQQITATYGNTNGGKTLHAIGCNQIVAGSPLDVTPTPTTGTSTSPSISSGTLAVAAELVLAGLVTASGAGSASWSAPFTIIGTNQQNGANQRGSASEDVTTSTGSVTATATITSANWGCVMISLKGAPITATAAPAGLGAATALPALSVGGAAGATGTAGVAAAIGTGGTLAAQGSAVAGPILGVLGAPAGLGAATAGPRLSVFAGPAGLGGAGVIPALGGGAVLGGAGTAMATVSVKFITVPARGFATVTDPRDGTHAVTGPAQSSTVAGAAQTATVG
jgi:hypothetical protein